MIAKEDLAIIIVDDLQFSCEVVKSGLKKSGFKDIRTANSANEAMLQINQRLTDVILADFWMPEMNGLEMTDLIRRWDESNNRYTGIILFTAEDNTSSIVVAFDRGVDDFLSKSANHFEMAARVFGAGRNARLQNQLRKINKDLTNQFQNYNHLNLIDIDTGLINIKQLEISMESMISHCGTRGGGLAIALIRIQTEDSGESDIIRKGTLLTISNSLQMVLRPMDQIARFDPSTFAISIIYSDKDSFNPDMFKRCKNSVLSHTHQLTDEGKKIKLSMSEVCIENFDPIPQAKEILISAERDLKVDDTAATS